MANVSDLIKAARVAGTRQKVTIEAAQKVAADVAAARPNAAPPASGAGQVSGTAAGGAR